MHGTMSKCDEFVIKALQEQNDLNKKVKLLIEVKNEESEDAKHFLVSCGCDVKKHFSAINTYLIETDLNALTDLINSHSIVRISYDRDVWALLDVAVQAIGVQRDLDTKNGTEHTGAGVTIGILDTGVYPHKDLVTPKNRIIAFKDFINGKDEPYDDNGHGTHVAGCALGNGISSDGKYQGAAPQANLVAAKVLDSMGRGNASSIISAVQWMIDNKDNYNIGVISLSLGSYPIKSYKEDPLCLILEKAWDLGMTVMVAAGNSGPSKQTIGSPAVHPKLIAVGAIDDKDTIENTDDTVADFSSRGPTIEGIDKPDIVAPGTNIVALRAPNSYTDRLKPDYRIEEGYFTLSGTSMATPIAAGMAALLLEQRSNLKPDEIKQLMMEGALRLYEDKYSYGKGLINYQQSLNLLDGNEEKPVSGKVPGEHSLVIKWGSDIPKLLENEIMQLNKNVYIATPVITDVNLITLLCEASLKNISVNIALDLHVKENVHIAQYLTNYGVNVFQLGQSASPELQGDTSFAIIDNKKVLLSSASWRYLSYSGQREFVINIENNKAVSYFMELYHQLSGANEDAV
ncbi:S8 family serine peptidase [Cytobacillus sp. FSL H8-0458]|uniref:S8 family serine peptidase n=1 Tax=Cytobacillus sp. FSL H8-0458 TaxID=2975346 RepID=UPI0030F5AD7C